MHVECSLLMLSLPGHAAPASPVKSSFHSCPLPV
jgi:hypothetical protein